MSLVAFVIRELLPGDLTGQQQLGSEGAGPLFDVLGGPASEDLDQRQLTCAIYQEVADLVRQRCSPTARARCVAGV